MQLQMPPELRKIRTYSVDRFVSHWTQQIDPNAAIRLYALVPSQLAYEIMKSKKKKKKKKQNIWTTGARMCRVCPLVSIPFNAVLFVVSKSAVVCTIVMSKDLGVRVVGAV